MSKKGSKYGYNGNDTFRPLGPWAYFGYSILFSLPLIGLIVNIILCFSDGNVNRRSFARSVWCFVLLITVLFVAAGVYFFLNVGFDNIDKVINAVEKLAREASQII